MLIAAISLSLTLTPAGQVVLSISLLTFSPVRVVAAISYDGLVADQRLAASILGDGREPPVLDLVPLAGAGRPDSAVGWRPR
jgi:hypothetical protein